MYIYTYNSVYYSLLYTFFNFFLIGIVLCVLQVELFSAFLWLVECSVLFIFLLLLFYINIKNIFKQTEKHIFKYLWLFIYLLFVFSSESLVINDVYNNISIYFLIDNYYESLFNTIQNDLFIFFISYYFINSVEFVIVGMLLLVGSIVCINLFLFNKNIRTQNYNSFFKVFNFFLDLSSFLFLKKQNLIKQGNTKASLKIFKKK